MTNEQRSSQHSQGAIVSQSRQAASSTSRQPLPMAWIERLFARLSAFYGSKFADLWRGCDLEAVKAVWANELAGYSRDELARGIAACRTRDWPPTLPEFMKACRPPLDYEHAFLEAVEQMRLREAGEDRWSTPAVFWAAVKLGSDLSAYPYQSIKGRWKAAIDEAIDGIRAGKLPAEVPKRRETLPAPGQCSVPPEVAKQRLAAIRGMLAAKTGAA
jgi:hypothetical protein